MAEGVHCAPVGRRALIFTAENTDTIISEGG